MTDAYLAHNAIPIQFTTEDFDQVIDGGNFVTKVIYLPDPKYQELAVSGVETLVSTRLEPGVDPILEADKRGTILLILRLGAIDLEMQGSSSTVLPARRDRPAGTATELAPGTLPPGVAPAHRAGRNGDPRPHATRPTTAAAGRAPRRRPAPALRRLRPPRRLRAAPKPATAEPAPAGDDGSHDRAGPLAGAAPGPGTRRSAAGRELTSATTPRRSTVGRTATPRARRLIAERDSHSTPAKYVSAEHVSPGVFPFIRARNRPATLSDQGMTR